MRDKEGVEGKQGAEKADDTDIFVENAVLALCPRGQRQENDEGGGEQRRYRLA